MDVSPIVVIKELYDFRSKRVCLHLRTPRQTAASAHRSTARHTHIRENSSEGLVTDLLVIICVTPIYLLI
jgi:hypothetical protein